MIGVFVQYGNRCDSPGWVIDGNGCHIWVGALNKEGYGVVRVGSVMRVASRARYEREIGPIPEGLVLDHYVCDNGAGGCCNPHHCRPVTQRENVLRGSSFAADHASRTHCPAGHELVGDNLEPSQLVRGRRACRICSRERKRRIRAARLAV